MPAPTEIEDVVVPLQLQPVVDRPRGWRGRSGGLVAIALAGFLVTALILGRAADPGPAQPAIAALGSAPARAVPSVTIPRATPSSEPVATPVATPLPAREVIGGRIPDERRIVYANGVQVLDLATGTLEPTTRPLYDRMLPVADDQVVCACTLGGIEGGDATVPASIRFGRYDLAGRPIVEREVLSLHDVVAAPDVTSGFNLTSTLSADRRTLYVLIATRRPPSWSIDVYEVRVRDGRTLGHALLGRLPTDPAASATASPSPSDSAGTPTGEMPDGIYVWVNGLAAAPGGRTLHAVIGYVDLREGVWNNYDREWMVPLHSGHPGNPIQIRTDGQPNDDWCVSVPQFVDDDLLVEACAAGPVETVDTTYQLRRFASDGTRLEDLPVEGFSTSLRYPVVTALDHGARAMYLWDPVRHLIGRIDVDTGAASTSAAQVSLPPDVSADSLGIGVDPGLVVSPDGSRLYALGMLANGSPAGRSTGIWVFDARTLQPLDHWPARARLTSLAVSADGTFVYAAGAQGFDADGNAGASGASVTVYDATTGEIQVIYGSVSPDGWLNFPTWP